jgi:hypothetical protein
MTRVLSELLGAKEPAFRHGLRQLEKAGGGSNEDIRLSSDITSHIRRALLELGLDPNDTSGRELYAALMNRTKQDELVLRKIFDIDSNCNDLSVRIMRAIDRVAIPKTSFALKNSTTKRLLKKNAPKKAMKMLGYRSLDSMLKHEAPALIYAAAEVAETPAWHRHMMAAYKNVSARDFETRNISVLAPEGKNWEKLAANYVGSIKNNILAFNELGAVVLLPVHGAPDGAALACLLLSLHAINGIRMASTYLKLHQVKPDFGEILARSARSDQATKAKLLGEALPWNIVHHFFARSENSYAEDLFQPHVQPEDLHWQPAEQALAMLHNRFAFWAHAAYLGLLDQGNAVSLNLTDAALNFCNNMPYEKRVVSYFRDHLWHELLMRYIHQDKLEAALQEELHDTVDDARLLA